MIFGKKTVRREYGNFSSDGCEACGDGTIFKLFGIRKYLVIFFAKLIPISEKFEMVCEACQETKELESGTGRSIVKKYFPERHRSFFTADALRIAAAVVVLAAIIAVPLALIIPAPGVSPQVLKDLVNEEGAFSVHNADGDVLGIVQVKEGKKLLVFYDKTSILSGEPGTNERFIRHEHYQEQINADGETQLVRVAASPGTLKDKYGLIVRHYYYNKSVDRLGYERGVEDLSSIEYTPGKAVYPFSYYMGASEPSSYVVVLYIRDDKRFEATFALEDEGALLATLFERRYENGRMTKETVFQFDEPTLELAKQAGISPESTIQDIEKFLEENAPAALMNSEYTYYKNTRLPSSVSIMMAGSENQSSEEFEITQKGGYYIVNVPTNQQ